MVLGLDFKFECNFLLYKYIKNKQNIVQFIIYKYYLRIIYLLFYNCMLSKFDFG